MAPCRFPIRVDRLGTGDDYILNAVAIESYWRQVRSIAERVQAPAAPDLGSLLLMPGVVSEESRRSVDLDADWRIMQSLLEQALTKLQVFRVEEGRSMQRDLTLNAQIIGKQLEQVVVLAPQVVSEYRTRMLERVRQVLTESEAKITEADLLREVSIYV